MRMFVVYSNECVTIQGKIKDLVDDLSVAFFIKS